MLGEKRGRMVMPHLPGKDDPLSPRFRAFARGQGVIRGPSTPRLNYYISPLITEGNYRVRSYFPDVEDRSAAHSPFIKTEETPVENFLTFYK